MKRIATLILGIGMISAMGQVKIGDNPTTINQNSLLELESPNKGFLPPRVALNSVSTTSPLTSSTPAGMLVYSSGGSLSDGYYTWSGSKWLPIATSVVSRVNHVIVKSQSDFPAATGGVINLVPGTLYEINGSITLTNKININGCTVKGTDATSDKLIYTGTEEIFTGSDGGSIRFLTLTAPSGKIFNLNAGGATKNLVVENCYIVSSSSIGTIKGFGGTVYFQTIAYINNQNGIIYENDYNVVVNVTLWDSNNKNIYEKFTGTFNLIQLIGGDRLTASLTAAVALDITGITSISAGSIRSVTFMGSGSYVAGTFGNEWEVESFGINTEKDDVASGNIYLTSAQLTTFNLVNTPTKVLCSTTPATLFRIQSLTNNRMTYTGNKTRRFLVIASLTFFAQSTNKNFSFYIVKNGVVVSESRQAMRMNTGSDKGSITLTCNIPLAKNDYIEVWAENNSDNTALTVESMNVSIK